MSQQEAASKPDAEYDIGQVLEQLEELENTVDSSDERREVRRTRRMLEAVPGSERIKKYTTRDVAEGFVGGIIFSLPLLVEDGVFEISKWFTATTLGPVPVFLTLNVLFIITLVAGLLYYTDIRDVHFRLVFGFIPKRLVVTLAISFTVAAGMMFMWGRLHEEDPTRLEMLGRITVIWAAAALGATLGDILPGESKGTDISQRISEIGDGNQNHETIEYDDHE